MHCGSTWLVYVKAQTSLCIQAMTVDAATQRSNAMSLNELLQKKDQEWKSRKEFICAFGAGAVYTLLGVSFVLLC